jgi:two-component system chemotaxis response regulator CheB
MSIDQEGKIALVSPSSKTGQLTSVDTLFQSVAEQFGGSVIAILLTGMGSDGGRGLLALRKKGAVTIVQSAETAAVNGMPGAAVKLDAAVLILPPDQIPGTINMFFSKP